MIFVKLSHFQKQDVGKTLLNWPLLEFEKRQREFKQFMTLIKQKIKPFPAICETSMA